MHEFMLAWLIAAAVASSAGAQAVQDDRDGDSISPITSYPVGNPEAIGQVMLRSMKDQERKDEACRELGCLVLINDSRSYELRGFYVRPIQPRGAEDWGQNQLDRPLASREAIIRFKLPDQRFCDWPVRFVLRNPKTKDVVVTETNASLCADPKRDTVLRVRYIRPEVHVGAS